MHYSEPDVLFSAALSLKRIFPPYLSEAVFQWATLEKDTNKRTSYGPSSPRLRACSVFVLLQNEARVRLSLIGASCTLLGIHPR